MPDYSNIDIIWTGDEVERLTAESAALRARIEELEAFVAAWDAWNNHAQEDYMQSIDAWHLKDEELQELIDQARSKLGGMR